MATKPTELEVLVTSMTCAACAARIEKVLNRLPSVAATVNLATEHARVSYDVELANEDVIIAAIRRAGYGARPIIAASNAEEDSQKLAAYQAERRLFWIAAALYTPFLIQMLAMFIVAQHDLLPRWSQLLLPFPCSFGSANAIMSVPIVHCAATAPTWTCWSRSVPVWPFSSVPR